MSRSSIGGAAVAAALALTPGGSAAPRTEAQNVCVVVTAGGLVSQTTGPTCVTTPFPTRPLHEHVGVAPYLWVEVSVTYP